MSVVDLELAFRPQINHGYTVDARLTDPGNQANVNLATNAPVAFDTTALLALTLDPTEYGRSLTRQIFPATGPLFNAWQRARALADGAKLPLRLRLHFNDDAEDLHAVRWETLRDPLTDIPLALDARIRLVRYLSSNDTRPIILGPRPHLHLLLVVANPRDLSRYNLKELDVEGEVSRVKKAVGTISMSVIGDHNDAVERRATQASLLNTLRRERPSILCLICHGNHHDTDTILWLEDEKGNTIHASGSEIAKAIAQLDHLPLLTILIACEGAGVGHQRGSLAALGPRLALAGIGAVLAIQAKLSMDAEKRMLPVLFEELTRDGAIDRAGAFARAALRSGDEWWKPALWLRVRDGMLWQDRQQENNLFELLSTLPVEEYDSIPTPDTFSSAYYTVPHRIPLFPNELFTGREKNLRALASLAKENSGVIVIHGIGGVGKTQLAAEFAHRYGRYFAGGVFWIDCSVPENIVYEIIACSGPEGLNLPKLSEKTDSLQQLSEIHKERIQQIRFLWQSPTPRLIIFDNCEEEETLRMYRPPTGGCRLIVTSRRQQWAPGQGIILHELSTFNRSDSINLLEKMHTGLSEETASSIANECGDLPLALHLAGSFLSNYPSITASAFLSDIRKRRLEHPSMKGRGTKFVPTYSPQGREAGVFTVFNLSISRLNTSDATNTLARSLLTFIAHLDPPGVSFSRSLLSFATLASQDDPDTILLVDDAIGILINLGLLISESNNKLYMHRLIRDVVLQAFTEYEDFEQLCMNLLKHNDEAIGKSGLTEGCPLPDLPLSLRDKYESDRNKLLSAAANLESTTIDETLAEYRDILQKTRDYYLKNHPQPVQKLHISAVRQSLSMNFPQGWTVLIYVLHQEEILLVAISEDEIQLKYQVLDGQIRKLIERATNPRYRIYTYMRLESQAGKTTPWSDLEALGELLIPETIRKNFHASHRILIDSGALLDNLPWSALRINKQWLIEQSVVQQIPSLTAWLGIANRRPTRDEILLIGDISTENSDIPDPQEGSTSIAASLLNAIKQHWPAKSKGVEASAVTRDWLQTASFTGSLQGYRLVYWGLGSSMSANQPLLSHLTLDEGCLLVDEVTRLQLNGAIVVLPFGDSATTSSSLNDYRISLSHALLSAGACDVIGSLWHLYEKTALHLLAPLFAFLSEGMDAPSALAHTQRFCILEQNADIQLVQTPLVWAGIRATGVGISNFHISK